MNTHSSSEPKPGDVLEGRFALKRILGHGAFGVVWEATDASTGARCAVKLLPASSGDPVVKEYVEYLQRVRATLAATNAPNLSLPISQGMAAGGIFYEVLHYFPEARSLEQVIHDSAPMKPGIVFTITSQVATGLAALHSKSIVHSDLKPTNILLSANDDELTAFVTDLGMSRTIEPGAGTVLVGTPRYIHPDLLAGKPVGPYVDIYSLGLVTLAMLTTHPDVPIPLTEAALSSHLSAKNPALQTIDRRDLDRIVNLLFQMLVAGSAREGIAAETVRSLAQSLCDDLRTEHIVIDDLKPLAVVEREIELKQLAGAPRIPDEFAAVLERIESVLEDLAASTAALFARGGQLQTTPSPERDERILHEVTQLFGNALGRTRTAWRLGLGMTLITFGVITVMIVSALTLSITTGKSQWAVVFGGLSLPLIIGTLIWRPYDRVFRATILIQQIELIHVQTTAGFRGTLDLKERMRICREAIVSLQALFNEQTIPERPNKRGRRARSPQSR